MFGENIFDKEGFILIPSRWNESLAKQMAEDQFKIHLTDLHLQIIRFVREFYVEWESMPMMKTIRERFNLDDDQLDEMFRHGRSSSRGVICKLGGLPKMLCIASGC